MFGNRTILYWFREPEWSPASCFTSSSLRECSGFIPVFCFDSREEQFFNDKADYLRFRNATIEQVAELRASLQSKGSNLLIVNGSYEVIIPSLSRVLNADEVVTGPDALPQHLFSPGLLEFRNRKTDEIHYNLKMHSISMKVEQGARHNPDISDMLYLPPFPEINPGPVPVKAFHET